MNSKFIVFVKENKFAIGVFTVALVAVLWFGGRMVASMIYFNDPRHQDQALQGWMTPRYVVMSYDLPPPLVLETFGLTKETRRQKLRDIAAELDVSMAELTDLVRATAQTHRQNNP